MALNFELEQELDLDLDYLESDLRQMAKKLFDYRRTVPDHLRNTLDSALSSHRPVIDSVSSSRLTISETQVPVLSRNGEQDSREKMLQLKERMSRNAANIHKVVKRVRDCVESIHKLNALDRTIHPAFKRQRIN